MTTVFDVSNRKQLFIDDRWFDRQEGMTLQVNPPMKTEIVLKNETAWEVGRCGGYADIIEHEGVYKLWYDAYAGLGPRIQEGLARSVSYATSTDGLHWERQNVNLYDWAGHKENNIVMPGVTAAVLLDPKGPDEHRFKALGMGFENDVWSETQGVKWDLTGGSVHLWTSPDGIRWKRHRPLALPFFHDSHNQMLYDDRIDKYVVYLRTHGRMRTVSRLELDDLMETPWPYRKPPAHIKPNQHGLYMLADSSIHDITMACDDLDPPDTDVQQPVVTKYPWAEDVYLCNMVLYRHAQGKNNDGPNDVQLAVSRDGISWHRPQRKPYIPLGLAGDWDGGCIWPTTGMIRSGNEIWQYYNATWHTHGGYTPETKRTGGLRRLVQRLDGFVSADADYTGAEFSTPPLRFTGNQLELNVDCSAMGTVQVEIRDEQGKPIEGYTLDDAIPVGLNQIDAPVHWKNGVSVGALQDRPIRLFFKLRACKLYAFQFTSASTQTRTDLIVEEATIRRRDEEVSG